MDRPAVDDFASRIDRRLDRIDEQARRVRDERVQRHWDESRQRFESRMRLLFWGYGVAFGIALAMIVAEIADRA